MLSTANTAAARPHSPSSIIEQANTEQFDAHHDAHHDHHHNHHHNHELFTLNKASTLQDYLYNNKLYAEKMNEFNEGIFESNGKGQAPHTLWIGCSDSRYNENVLNVAPGEVFTFKNIANILNPNDITTKSILEFSINVLKVKKIIVCGHTDCGGIWNSLSYKDLGESNANLMTYLKKIDELRDLNKAELEKITNLHQRCKKLAELNVLEQLAILKSQHTVTNALNSGDIEIWGLIYNVDSGLLEVVEA